jgi:hypothetical protein
MEHPQVAPDARVAHVVRMELAEHKHVCYYDE